MGLKVYSELFIPSHKDISNFYTHSSEESVGEFGCQEYIGSRNKLGYGVFEYQGVTVLSHRFMYYLYHCQNGQPMPEVVRHKVCDWLSCCRIDHLEGGTPLDNAQDRDRKGRGTKGRIPSDEEKEKRIQLLKKVGE